MPFYDLSEMPAPELFPGWHGKVIHSERMTFVRWSVPAGAVLPNHSHPHEQLAHLISGEFDLTIDGETRRIRSGSVAVIPPNAQHSGIAITACEFTDSFCPIREDYRK
jgi:quercetin dioxygenase-like cupin family protein